MEVVVYDEEKKVQKDEMANRDRRKTDPLGEEGWD